MIFTKKWILSIAVVAFSSIFSQQIESATYRLFVHGRSDKNHCQALTSVNSGTSDHNNYWGGAVTGLSNVRYVGFDGTQSGGAYSWNNCGAQKQLNDALRVFCTGGNNCEVYTHSTGGLVAAAYFALNNPAVSVSRIQLMAHAGNGSELANISTSYLAWLGFDTLGGQLDQSVSTSAATAFNHNQTRGRTYYLTSGTGSDYLGVTSPLLPGNDDGVLAEHSTCGINQVAAVNTRCTSGNGVMTESYSCGFLYLSTCYRYWYRYTSHYSIYNSSNSHGQLKSSYNRR